MIKPDLTASATNLEEFYEQITAAQQGSHGKEYTEHHKSLIACANDPDVNVIKELGVCQGATFAALMMTKPKKLIGYDIASRYIDPYKHLFDKYAKEHNLDYEFHEMSSHDTRSVSQVDMLHIDSLHTPAHLQQELRMHAPKVRKYIVLHDTANFKGSSGLFVTIAKYITEMEQLWKVHTHYIHRVGYTVLERVNRIQPEWK
jgi:hypothetical protein